MKATALLTNQLQLVHERISGLADLTPGQWAARPSAGDNPVGFTAWHMAATRDWAIRAILQAKRPLGWDPPFAGTGIALCPIPFGMDATAADALAAAVSPVQVVEYSEAVTGELARWLASVDDSVLDLPPADGRAHYALSPGYGEPGYLSEFEEHEFGAVTDNMGRWPAWALLTRPCFSHCIAHLAEIEVVLNSS